MDTTKVQLGEPINVIGVTYRNMGERLPHRSRNDSETSASPWPGPAWATAHKAGNLELIAQIAKCPREDFSTSSERA